MSDLERLNDATERLKRIKGAALTLAAEARKEARARCEAGQIDLSAEFHEIEADLLIGAGYLTRAYGKGRRLRIPGEDGDIVARIGGS